MTRPETLRTAVMPFEEAEELSLALDFASRLAHGQVHELSRVIGEGVAGKPVPDPQQARDAVEGIRRALGYPYGRFHGIGSRAVPAIGPLAYEVHKVIERAVAGVREPGGRDLRHDGLTVRYSGLPAPEARAVTRDGADAVELTLSAGHARAARTAVDLWARLCSGDLHAVTTAVQQGVVPVWQPDGREPLRAGQDAVDRVHERMRALTDLIGTEEGSAPGERGDLVAGAWAAIEGAGRPAPSPRPV